MLSVLVLVALVQTLNAIPVPNGVEGDPEIECGATDITISFNTQDSFEGHIFVKGLYNEPGCRDDTTGGRVASISLPFDTCNVQRVRSANPRGIFVTTTVIISFHPQFITKVDRAYRIQCFYMEADKTVTTELEVSMLTTGFQTQIVPMPVCRYEILDGGPTGEIIRYAIVGQQVYHKWTCDTETIDTFCMRVHSCFVDDGAGDTVTLLDESGCAQDRYLLRNLEYQTDLMAGQETHVFKYADRPQLFFQCQIAITIKEPFGQCELPQCPEPVTGRRKRFAPAKFTEQPAAVVDVIAELESLDLEDNSNKSPLPLSVAHRAPTPVHYQPQSGFCLSYTGFSFLMALTAVLVIAAFTSLTMLCIRREK